MSSAFTWLDHKPDDAQRVREALRALEQPGTIDPLGFGVVRDAFSELLFPGLSTVMTRARYFLFIPWIFQLVDESSRKRSTATSRARELEVRLIHALLNGSPTDRTGIIGQNSREGTKQLPSLIYWGGLGRLNIRRFPGTRTDYFATVASRRGSDGPSDRPWHPALRDLRPPDDWLDATDLSLSSEEAGFLRDRVLTTAPDTFFAVLARDADRPIVEGLPWTHPLVDTAPPAVKRQVHHARLFAIAMWGAGLIYNRELAELRAKDSGQPVDDAAIVTDLATWTDWVQGLSFEFDRWDRDEMWGVVRAANPSVGAPRPFIDWWLELVVRNKGSNVDSADVRRLIRKRELDVKGSRAKLANRRAREKSEGASGQSLMTYRWPTARAVVTDIVEASS